MVKFLVGLILGVAIAIGVVYYLNNNQSKFISKISSVSIIESDINSAKILEPNTKIKNIDDKQSDDYDFYQILQDNDASATIKKNGGRNVVGSQINIQVGDYSDENTAHEVKGRLAFLGYEAKIVSIKTKDGLKNKVVIGPFKFESAANSVKEDLDKNGIKSILLK